MTENITSAGAGADEDFGEPVVGHLSQATKYDYYATDLNVLLRAEQTGGKFFMNRTQDVKPEDAPPFHRHTREEEIWIIHEGTFRFWIGGTSLATATVYDVGPGDVVFGPRGVAHTFQSLTDHGDCTIIWSPGASQSYFLNVEKTDERKDFEHLERLEAIGVEVLDRAPVNGH
ncbi:cupin domain-containing protein [Mycobacteroides abscessus]